MKNTKDQETQEQKGSGVGVLAAVTIGAIVGGTAAAIMSDPKRREAIDEKMKEGKEKIHNSVNLAVEGVREAAPGIVEKVSERLNESAEHKNKADAKKVV